MADRLIAFQAFDLKMGKMVFDGQQEDAFTFLHK
jgi:hypothetical protein